MTLTLRRVVAGIFFAALAGCDSSQPLSGKSAQKAVCTNPVAGEVSYCEQRDYPDLATSGSAQMRSTNGFVYATGDGRSTISLTALVYAKAATEARAKEIAAQVVVHTSDDDFYATGPENLQSAESWGVSFDAMTPATFNLNAHSLNDNLQLSALNGNLDASTTNGDARLNGLSGSVQAATTNGSITISLAGTSWTGEGLRADASNGSVFFGAPADYSARVTLDAQNGTTESDFSGGTTTEPSPTDSHYEVTLGNGGALLTGSARNGNAELRQQNSTP